MTSFVSFVAPGCEQVRCDSSFLCPEIGTEPVIDGKCCGKCMKLGKYVQKLYGNHVHTCM